MSDLREAMAGTVGATAADVAAVAEALVLDMPDMPGVSMAQYREKAARNAIGALRMRQWAPPQPTRGERRRFDMPPGECLCPPGPVRAGTPDEPYCRVCDHALPSRAKGGRS